MKVTFEDRPALHGTRIAIATLDAPRQLNALSLPMIEALLDQFNRWATDPAVVCVLLRGNGESVLRRWRCAQAGGGMPIRARHDTVARRTLLRRRVPSDPSECMTTPSR